MKKHTGLAFVAFGASVIASPAMADEVNWTGFYGGVNLAVTTGRSSWSDIVVPSDTDQNLPGEFSRESATGVGGGVQFGYQREFGHMVIGAEARAGYADLQGSGQCLGQYGDFSAQCTTKLGFNGGVAARLGVATGRALIYATGGVNWADLKLEPANEKGFSTTGGYGSTSRTRAGYLVGGGFEYALDNHLSLGVEYNYHDYGSFDAAFTGVAPVNEYNPDFSITARAH